MAVGVARDHHNLRRNLYLNGNYISNDGGDEGITIQDDGDVIINGDTKLYLNDAGGEYLNSDGTDLTITSGRDIILDASGAGAVSLLPGEYTSDYIFINKDSIGISTGTYRGALIDFDVTAATAVAQTATNIGLDIDLNSDNSLTHLGDSNNYGININLTGSTSGDQKNIGIGIAVASADINYALITSGGNVGIGVADPDELLEVAGDLKISGANKLYLYDTGGEHLSSDGTDLTIASGNDMTLDAEGDITLDANGADITFSDAGAESLKFTNSSGSWTIIAI